MVPGATPHILRPRDVNELVRGAINRHIPSTLHVLGQVADVSRPISGHLYFTLKDAESELRCVLWRSAAAKLAFRLDVGMEVIATGGLDVYTPRGSYQLMVRKIEPRGVGALELAFRQLREKLEREGLFDPARKRPLPRFPQRVALVTSPTGAAIRDILQTLQRRYPALDVYLFPVRVQGEGAAGEIAAAIRLLNAMSESLGHIDVAIVGRGGGSLEDLWAFNEEVVARAVAASRVPIVSAVGHEIDITICDLVADVRAATPTAAAELITPRAVDLLQRIDECQTRLNRGLRHTLDLARGDLSRLLASRWLARPIDVLHVARRDVDERLYRAAHALNAVLRARRAGMQRAEVCLLRFAAGAHFLRLAQRLDGRVSALRQRLSARLSSAERELAADYARLQRALPIHRLARYEERIDGTVGRLLRAAVHNLEAQKALLSARFSALQACDPRRVLSRGYSLTRDARSGRLLRSVSEVRDGQRIVTELSDGSFRSTAEDPRQPGLFDVP